jgi:hypothetical protein
MVSRMTNVELINAVIKAIKRDIGLGEYDALILMLSDVPRENLMAFLPESEDTEEEGICPACNGSGEGMREGTTCRTCRGSGES